MYQEDILNISYHKYIKTWPFLLVICIAKDLIWTTWKAIFSICRFCFHPQIPDIQIVVSQQNIVPS